MDTQRLILFFVFVFSIFMLVEGWQREQRAQAPATSGKSSAELTGNKEGGNVAVPKPSAKDVPAVPERAANVPVAPAAPAASATAGNAGDIVKVETDVLLAQLSTVGGDLVRLELKQHKGTLDKSKNFVLFESGPEHKYFAQSGLTGQEGLPNHHTRYAVSSRDFKLADGSKALEVRLEAPEANGIKVAQVYKFTRGSYVIDVAYEITNGSAKALQPYGYFQLVRDRKPPDGDSAMLPTFTGLAVYTKGEKFQKVSFDDVDKGKTPYSKDTQDEGWVAVVQHYFLSAFLPSGTVARVLSTLKLESGFYSARVVVTGEPIAAGQQGTIRTPLYAGPQDTRTLEDLAPGLDLVVDFGILTVIAKPLFKLLTWIHGLVGNWGIAIILLTVLIKALFYPLQAASYKAMAKMKVIAPKMQQLKERYGDDRQRMQKAMMELYQKEKVNPMAGCLPIIVQMPVFIALYWVILASVELRHAPFYGWIHDLSSVDPWYILPVLMGASMIIQTKLNPEPPDPVQAKVMKIMPIAFSIFFFFFPAGLVLYWLVNNILSIAQQWQINGAIERANQKARAKA